MQHQIILSAGPLTLRPLVEADIAPLSALAQACQNEYTQMSTAPYLPQYYQTALAAPDQLPFVIMQAGEYAGGTRFQEIRPQHRRLEIGSTWLLPQFMRSGLNRRCKALLLAYAFEQMGILRVEIKTDIINTRSQGSIVKLGAVREGILRQHMTRPDGSQRDTVMYSITLDDWSSWAV